jgi:hypothetical protein
MAQLPPVGWADVATKHDLAQLREYMDVRFDMVNERFEALEARFDGMLDRLEGRLHQLRGEMFDRMAQQSVTFLRTTVLSIFGSVLTVASLMFGAFPLTPEGCPGRGVQGYCRADNENENVI